MASSFLLFGIAFLFLTGEWTAITNASVPPSEVQALSDFYSSTDGPNWIRNDNWNQGDPCDNNWYSVTCNYLNTHVVEISLGLNGLRGSIPESIANSTFLQFLSLEKNSLEGRIPSSLSGMPYLDYLYLYSNNLTGAIDEWICDIESDLSNNHFACPLPRCCDSEHGDSSCEPCFATPTPTPSPPPTPISQNYCCWYSEETDPSSHFCSCLQEGCPVLMGYDIIGNFTTADCSDCNAFCS